MRLDLSPDGWRALLLDKIDFLEPPAFAGGRLGLTSVPGPDGARRIADALERDLRGFSELGVARIVCLLPDAELESLGAGELPRLAAEHGLGFDHFPLVDGHAPADGAGFAELVEATLAELRTARTVVAHCRAGFGRTGTFAACCLVASGVPPTEAITQVRSVRRYAIETAAQEAFVQRFRRADPSP
jgi:protein-tyrosine phosphatase